MCVVMVVECSGSGSARFRRRCLACQALLGGEGPGGAGDNTPPWRRGPRFPYSPPARRLPRSYNQVKFTTVHS